MMYNDALRWLERIFNSSMLPRSPATTNEAWGGIYIAQPFKLAAGKRLTKSLNTLLIRRSVFVITGLTGECIFPATSRYCSNGYLINCTDALEIIVGLTGECKLRNPPKNRVSGQLHRRSLCLDRRFNRCLQNSCCLFSLQVHYTGECKTPNAG